MRKLTPILTALLAVLMLLPAPAWSDVVARLLGTAPEFYDLSQLTPAEVALNRHGRRIPIGRVAIEVYRTFADVADTNVRAPVVDCINQMGGSIPQSPDDPLLVLAPGCEIHDYSRYRWFDYGDPGPDSSSFGLSKIPMDDPVLGTLLDVTLTPSGVTWAEILPPGLYLTGSNQFNANDTRAATNPGFFRSAIIHRMFNDEGVARLEIFIPSIISPLFTGQNTAIGQPASVIELGFTDATERLLRPEETPVAGPSYQTPLCVNIIDHVAHVSWSAIAGIDFVPSFNLDDSTLSPPYPFILRTSVATRKVNQPPTAALQRDVRFEIYTSPVSMVAPSSGPPDDTAYMPTGAVRLFEERANYLFPVMIPDNTHEPFFPKLSIIPVDSGVLFANNLMTRLLNFYVTDTPPNAAFGSFSTIALSQGPDAWTAEIQGRPDGNTGEMRFQAGLVRVPRSRLIEAVTTTDPARRCINFLIRLDDYCEECKSIQRIETEAPLVCFNPTTADR